MNVQSGANCKREGKGGVRDRPPFCWCEHSEHVSDLESSWSLFYLLQSPQTGLPTLLFIPSYVAMRASLLSQFMIENKKSSVFFRFLKTIFFYKPKPRKLWVKLFYAPVTKVLESKNAIHNNRNFIIKTKRYLVINPTTDMQEL